MVNHRKKLLIWLIRALCESYQELGRQVSGTGESVYPLAAEVSQPIHCLAVPIRDMEALEER